MKRQSFLRRYWKLLIVTLLIIGGVFAYYSRGEKPSVYETAVVMRGDIVQEVSVTGRVSSDAEVDLGFEHGGRVVSEPRKIGERVKEGDVLVRLDTSELSALRTQAKANLNYEKARLAELRSGSRTEDISISEAKVESAKTTLDDAKRAVFDKLRSAAVAGDDVIHNTADQFFKNPRSNSPELTLPVADAKLVIDIQSRRVLLEETLKHWSDAANTWTSASDPYQAIEVTETSLSQIKEFLDTLAQAVNGLQPASGLSQATIDSWKLAVSGVRSVNNTALSNTLAATEKYRSATGAVQVAQDELALKSVGPTQEAISAQEAKVSGMEAALLNYDAQIAKTMLRAPIKGVVTKQDAKLGETVSPNVPIVSLMSEGLFKIETNIPEADVAKVAIGDAARVTLDAYGADVIFSALVSTIDPKETIIEGVSTYKVKLRFKDKDERIRSGMTANIDVSTEKHEHVLMIPARAVTNNDGGKSVRVLTIDATNKEVVTSGDVTVGLRGIDGNVEIVSGLTEGERVVTFEQ
jgi:RND family efflux transporter MFP subunit